MVMIIPYAKGLYEAGIILKRLKVKYSNCEYMVTVDYLGYDRINVVQEVLQFIE